MNDREEFEKVFNEGSILGDFDKNSHTGEYTSPITHCQYYGWKIATASMQAKLDEANAKIVAQQARIVQLHCALKREVDLSDDEYTFENGDYSLNVISTTNDLSALSEHDKAKESKLDALEAENARLKAALTVIVDPNSNEPAFLAERDGRCNERIYEDIARDALKGK